MIPSRSSVRPNTTACTSKTHTNPNHLPGRIHQYPNKIAYVKNSHYDITVVCVALVQRLVMTSRQVAFFFLWNTCLKLRTRKNHRYRHDEHSVNKLHAQRKTGTNVHCSAHGMCFELTRRGARDFQLFVFTRTTLNKNWQRTPRICKTCYHY